MAYTSPLATGIQFLDKLGVYEILLPFLLVFTVVYAILEKTKLFGEEEYKGDHYTRKGLNSLFAFVVAFLVIASTRVVAAMNEAIANMVLLILLSVSFLITVGIFKGDKETDDLEKTQKQILTWIMFVGIILIFLHAVKTKDGVPWLYYAWQFTVKNINTGAFAALLVTVGTIVLMMFITKSPANDKKEG